MANDRRNKNRHGVLLLIILALLAMFGATAIAFVILTRSQKGGADAFHREARDTENAEKLLAQAMAQVIRGSNRSMSVLQNHSLLEDLYGQPLDPYRQVQKARLIGQPGIDDDGDGYIDETDGSEAIGWRNVDDDGDGDPDETDGSEAEAIGIIGVDDDGDGQVDENDGSERTAWNAAIIGMSGVDDDNDGDIDEPDGSERDCFSQLDTTTISGGQVIEFRYHVANPEQYVGCVLTVLDGPARGQSRIIIGRRVSTNSTVDGKLRILAFTNATPNNGDHFLINRPVYSGTGFGWNWFRPDGNEDGIPDTPPLGSILNNALDPNGWEYALLPNPVAFEPNANYAHWFSYTDPAGPGGANEDYDIPDFQNMLLSTGIPVDITGDGVPDTVRLPSLHRPDLIDYWINRVGVSDWNSNSYLYQKLRRKVILRPLPQDHFQDVNNNGRFDAGVDIPFTGSNSNPNFDPAHVTTSGGASYGTYRDGPWDVDNDGDGIPDSIWVDLGLPARATTDGRLYKPLFAIHCVDLDGRLNLNAHGSTAQLAGAYWGNVSGAFARNTNVNPTPALPRGEGYGPADVRLSDILGADVAAVLRGSSALGLEGRYGESTAGTAEAGATGSEGVLSRLKRYSYPHDYTNFVSEELSAFGTPPDLWARGAIGLDFFGQPLYSWLAWTNERRNNPYELNLTKKPAASRSDAATLVDNPFTVAELEAVLRPYDIDASKLARRLVNLTSSLANARHYVTTESWALTNVKASIPDELRRYLPTGRGETVADLLRAKIIAYHVEDAGDWTIPLAAGNLSQLSTEVEALLPRLPWDILAGLPMDLNRPFGNGRDDNANAVVDEPQEADLERSSTDLFGNGTGNIAFQLPNGVTGVAQDRARQLYAQHLFVLLMLLRDAGYVQPTPNETLSATEQEELTTRRIAQWAINIVDFRDADAIMTPFEYDANPFDGWSVDGDISTDEGGDRRVVWGCEYPEVLITETKAFHDRRVADTAWDSIQRRRTDDIDNPTNSPDDADFDQPRIPQGSAFFELFCTRNRNNPVAPPDLYTYNSATNTWSLDLGRMAPADVGGVAYPVWRMVITESRFASADNDIWDAVTNATTGKPHSISLETKQYRGAPDNGEYSLLPLSSGAVPSIDIDRIVWFTSTTPTSSHHDYDRVFYRRGGTALLEPGRYAVVGPRAVTYIGSRRDPSNPNTLGIPSPHAIRLNPVGVVDNDGTSNYPSTSGEIQTPLGIIVGADPLASEWPNAATTAPTGIGINISEPLPQSDDYYPEPDVANPATGVIDAYGDLEQTDITKGYFRDSPLDGGSGSPLAGHTDTQTIERFATVFLQRLANPLAPWDATTNPYLTVDWSPIDLTVFNGEDREPTALPTWLAQWDPQDANSNATTNVAFRTQQRGAGTTDFNLWKRTYVTPAATSNEAVTEPNFRHNLAHTLGYLNEAFHDTSLTGGTTPKPWLTSATDNRGTIPADYYGAPGKPFPWLTWNNRPYANPMELALVPTSHPARLGLELTESATANPYDDSSATGLRDPYGHLPNLVHSDDTANNSPQLHRILDYVRVPSPFVGTEQFLNAANFANSNDETRLLRPPFNFVSTYREPGRVNINTVFNTNVWNGILNGHAGPTYSNLNESRQGFTGNWPPTTSPTMFMNPFRSPANSHNVPLAGMNRTRPVSVSLLRADTINPDTSSNPLFRTGYGDAYRDADRNPYFRYQGLQHLGNLVSTTSNVYAVWITVGYFEVHPRPTRNDPVTDNAWTDAQYRSVYPDGYALGQELGSDTGEIKRHRAFYIIDRSIPVGFRRGEDLNSGNCVLLKRFIE